MLTGGLTGSVLGIWAHPDDETYLTAGLMMRAVGAGHRVVCVTASRGEQGSTDPDRWPAGPELAALRTRESEHAMSILGVTEHHWLDYPDGGVADVPEADAVARIMSLVGDFVPDVVVSFPPNGLTGHPDHQAASRWAGRVHALLGGRPTLVHAVDLQSQIDLFADRWRELGIYIGDTQPEGTPDDQATVIALGGEERDRKWQALVAQRSQTEILFRQAGREAMLEFISLEGFLPVVDREEDAMEPSTASASTATTGVERFRRCVGVYQGNLAQVGPDQWGDPTPCTEWDVRALVNHVTGELAWMPPLIEGQTIAEVGHRLDGDLLGDDPVAAYDAAARAAVAAVSAPGAIDGTVQLSYGSDTTASYVDQVSLDCLIHAWDLARGAGVDDQLPEDLVDWATQYTAPLIDSFAASGSYAPPVQVGADASAQTRLLALLGRSA